MVVVPSKSEHLDRLEIAYIYNDLPFQIWFLERWSNLEKSKGIFAAAVQWWFRAEWKWRQKYTFFYKILSVAYRWNRFDV